MSLKKKKKGNISNISKSKKIPLPTFNLLKSEVQVQEMSLKKKKKGNVSNVLKSKKKIKENFSPTLQLTQFPFQSEVQVQETSLKKKKGRKHLVTFPNQKKNSLHSTHHSRVQYPRGRNSKSRKRTYRKKKEREKRKGMLVTFSNQKK
jgi:hypothetical protein